MAEARKNGIVMACSIVACVVTLLTCGTLIGNIQGNVTGLTSDVKELKDGHIITSATITDMKAKQSYLEGVVSTKLDTIQISVSNMEKQIDNLIRVP